MPLAIFIDNDMASLVLFEELCRKENIQYMGFQNSGQFLESLNKLSGVDIVFVDLEMPHPNGYELLAILLKNPTTRSLPIVACTVYSGETEHAQESGFSSFMLKPLNIDRFADQLRAILNGQAIWET